MAKGLTDPTYVVQGVDLAKGTDKTVVSVFEREPTPLGRWVLWFRNLFMWFLPERFRARLRQLRKGG